MPDPKTCPTCNGEGYIDAEFCPTCFGTGVLPVQGVFAFLVKRLIDVEDKVEDLQDKCNDIKEKCDEILEEIQNP